MLYAIAFTMIVLWLLGVPTPYTKGGMIHVLLVIALVAIVLRLMRRQNVWVTWKPDAIRGKRNALQRRQSYRRGKETPIRALLIWGSSLWRSS